MVLLAEVPGAPSFYVTTSGVADASSCCQVRYPCVRQLGFATTEEMSFCSGLVVLAGDSDSSS